MQIEKMSHGSLLEKSGSFFPNFFFKHLGELL